MNRCKCLRAQGEVSALITLLISRNGLANVAGVKVPVLGSSCMQGKDKLNFCCGIIITCLLLECPCLSPSYPPPTAIARGVACVSCSLASPHSRGNSHQQTRHRRSCPMPIIPSCCPNLHHRLLRFAMVCSCKSQYSAATHYANFRKSLRKRKRVFNNFSSASKGGVQLIQRLVRLQTSFRLGLKTACSLTGLSGLL